MSGARRAATGGDEAEPMHLGRVVPAGVAAVAIVAVANADGGYFALAWGWSASGFLLLALAVVAVSDRLELGRLDFVLAAAFAAYATWVLLSATWSTSATQPVLEAERTLVYLAAVVAALLLIQSSTPQMLALGVQVGALVVAAQALWTRVVPDEQAYARLASYRLAEPIGYWNALGIVCAIGVVLTFGLAICAPRVELRALATAALVVLAPTLYFTFSRGAYVALAAAAVTFAVLAQDRLRALVPALAPLAVFAAATFLCTRFPALTQHGFPFEAARAAGARLTGTLGVLSVMALAATLVVTRFARATAAAGGRRGVNGVVAAGARIRRPYRIGAIAAIGVFAVGVALARVEAPASLLGSAYGAFAGPPPTTQGDLNRHVLSLSGSGRAESWHVAWRQFQENRWLGSGAGTYERYWLRHRSSPSFHQRDAHNLYLETLAELGPAGLVLLAAALSIPVVAAVRVRRRRYVAAIAAAYVAFLVHAGLDWDWEMPVVVLSGLFCGTSLVVAARPESARHVAGRSARIVGVSGLVVLLGAVAITYAGNLAAARAASALAAEDVERGIDETRWAIRLAPWSSKPWQTLGELHMLAGDARAARGSFREALERDPDDWFIWLLLVTATDGPERDFALGEARRRNPLSPEVRQFEGTRS